MGGRGEGGEKILWARCRPCSTSKKGENIESQLEKKRDVGKKNSFLFKKQDPVDKEALVRDLLPVLEDTRARK